MTKRIQDIFATRRLKAIFDFTGRFKPQLDETIVPTVVIETFQISDFQRGPVEGMVAGVTVVSPVGQPAWAALVPPVGPQVPAVRPYTPVIRVTRVRVFPDNEMTVTAKIFPAAIPLLGVQSGTPIWQDRRFSAQLPDASIRENNALSVLPVGGVNVWSCRWVPAAPSICEWQPRNLILAPLHSLVVFTGENNRLLNYSFEWQELDPDQTPAPTI